MTRVVLQYPLKKPQFLLPDISISVVQLRRPKAKDLYDLDFKERPTESSVILCSRLSGIDSTLIAEMDLTDFFMMQDSLGKLMAVPKGTT